MKRAVIQPRRLHGTVTPPPSKSAAHRALVCAALSRIPCRVASVAFSEDIRATIDVLRALGAAVRPEGDGLLVDGSRLFQVGECVADCRESGSTLRFLIPVAAAGGVRTTFTGHGRLPLRPLGPYLELLPHAGVACTAKNGGLPLKISGRLLPGAFSLPGNVSSQFITGLLLALPLLPQDSTISLTTPLESAGYIRLTEEVMRRFGVAVSPAPAGYLLKGNQRYSAESCPVERDWSQAAFWLAAGALGPGMSCRGLPKGSAQSDRAVVDILRGFGAALTQNGDVLTCSGGDLTAVEVDASQIPDLVPVLAVVAAAARGTTVIRNAARLRLKESDRLHAIATGLNALGGNVAELSDGLRICGTGNLRGGEADGCNDHRIVMALAVASSLCREKVILNGCECVGKSYPDFFPIFNESGGNANVIDLG